MVEDQRNRAGCFPALGAVELLRGRRSIRKFRSDPIDAAILSQVFDICRYSPTAMNTQAWYLITITNPDILGKLAATRAPAANPICAAPMAVAIAIDGDLHPRVREDADIAATYLMLAARACGLGTCWIGGMNTPEVRSLLGVPENHYIATVTPLGYPLEGFPSLPERRAVEDFVRNLG